MKEKLIEFETAKLAKERGFDWEVEKMFSGLKLTENTSLRFDWNSQNNIDFISVPTQSLLQKWLRDVHGIYVESYHDLTANGKGIQYYTNWGFIKDHAGGGYDEYNDWRTYEEALEKGLQEALKLI